MSTKAEFAIKKMIVRSLEEFKEYVPECKTSKTLQHVNIVSCEKYWIEPVIFTFEELATEIN